MTFDHTYGTRAKQDAAGLQVTIDGMTDWKLPLQRKITIDPRNAHFYDGATEVTLETVYAKNADQNGTTNESRWLAGLINEGCVPIELEVSFTNPDEATWGRCQWLKEHLSYNDPENWLRKLHPEMTIPDRTISITNAMFTTEHAVSKSMAFSQPVLQAACSSVSPSNESVLSSTNPSSSTASALHRQNRQQNATRRKAAHRRQASLAGFFLFRQSLDNHVV